jgi:hypothetical protein
MKLIQIEVECHSGYKADEYPKYFSRGNDRFEIPTSLNMILKVTGGICASENLQPASNREPHTSYLFS